MPASNVPLSRDHCPSASFTSLVTVGSSTGRRKARVAKPVRMLRAAARRPSASAGIVSGKNRRWFAGWTQCSFANGPRTVTATTRSVRLRTGFASGVSGVTSNVSSCLPAAHSWSNSTWNGLFPWRTNSFSKSGLPSALNVSRHLL